MELTEKLRKEDPKLFRALWIEKFRGTETRDVTFSEDIFATIVYNKIEYSQAEWNMAEENHLLGFIKEIQKEGFLMENNQFLRWEAMKFRAKKWLRDRV